MMKTNVMMLQYCTSTQFLLYASKIISKSIKPSYLLDEDLRRALDNLKEALKVEKDEDMVLTANSC